LELEEARFGKTMKGQTAVFDKQGYRYVKNNSSLKAVYWRCEFRDKSRGGCPGNCITEGFFIKSKKGTHIHKPGEPVVSHLVPAKRFLPKVSYHNIPAKKVPAKKAPET
jgi:hypothetical protein